MQPGASRSCKRPAAEAALENIRKIRKAQTEANTTANNNARSRSNNARQTPASPGSNLTHYNAMLSDVTSVIETLTCVNNKVDEINALYNLVESHLEDEFNADSNPNNKARKTQELVIKRKAEFKRLVTSQKSSIGRALKIYYIAVRLAAPMPEEPALSNTRRVNRWLLTLSADIPSTSNTPIKSKVSDVVKMLVIQANRILRIHETTLQTYLKNKKKTAITIDLTDEQVNTTEFIDLTKDVENMVQVEKDSINAVETALKNIPPEIDSDPMDVLVDQLGKLDIRIGGRRQQRYRK